MITPALISPVSLAPVMPEMLMAGVGAGMVGFDALLPQKRHLLPWIATIGTMAALYLLATGPWGEVFNGMLIVDGYSQFFKGICLISVLFTVLISGVYLKTEALPHGEYYSLVIFASVGMMCIASTADLMPLYLGLELMAFSVYCLVGLLKKDTRSNEAAIKYFLLGSFSSALFLYGISLLYGMTGATSLALIAARVAALDPATNQTLLIALGLVLVAFSFKVGAAPFHIWTPDVYEGAPTSITAFMSVGPKAASFAVFGRVLVLGFPANQPQWGDILAAIALLTIVVGNVAAISQTSIKRMLAYSSIAHAGYALLGLMTGTNEGLSATMNYLLIYEFMNMGAFGVLIYLGSQGQRREKLTDFRGLAKTNPMVAALMLVFMFSLIGLPPTAGFIGKFYLLLAAVHAGYSATVTVAVIFSAISAFYYLRVIKDMYMCEPDQESVPVLTRGLATGLSLAAIGVVALGVLPTSVLELAHNSLMMGH